MSKCLKWYLYRCDQFPESLGIHLRKVYERKKTHENQIFHASTVPN